MEAHHEPTRTTALNDVTAPQHEEIERPFLAVARIGIPQTTGVGIALRGPAPAAVFPDVSVVAMRAASLRSLHDEWAPLLAEPAPLDDPHQQAYVILTLCRILYTARHDGVASKRDAAAWTRHAHPQWADLVRRAQAWQHGQSLSVVDEILAFLRFVIAETRRAEPTS